MHDFRSAVNQQKVTGHDETQDCSLSATHKLHLLLQLLITQIQWLSAGQLHVQEVAEGLDANARESEVPSNVFGWCTGDTQQQSSRDASAIFASYCCGSTVSSLLPVLASPRAETVWSDLPVQWKRNGS